MENSNKNLLKKNFDEWAIFSIIENTKNNERSVVAWKFVSGKKVTVEVVFYIIRKSRKEMIIKAASTSGKKLLGELSASANNLNFYLPDDMVLFQSEVKQIESNGDVRVVIPEMIAQVDRRKNFRLFIESGIKVKVSMKKLGHGHRPVEQLFEKDCFDISAGGFSIVVSKPEKKFFQVGDTVDSLEIEINGERIKAKSEVINIQEIQPAPNNNLHYRGWKIAFEFHNLASHRAKKIDDFVFRYLDIDKAI